MDFKDSLNLPKTDFPMKADLAKREPSMLDFWEEQRLSARLREERKGKPRWILHDGPPYANGDVHVGTALNKISKDIAVRYHMMKGQDAVFVPGWDCHGMPIEHYVLKKLGAEKENLNPSAVRKRCRSYAEETVHRHKKSFIRLGIQGHWSHPYLTMSPDYEAVIVESFWKLYKKGYIYRGLRPVHWCPSCQTALAEAEIEFKDVPGSSLTLAFPLESPLPALKGASLAVWTTTPWTLPANLAVACHPDEDYILVKDPQGQSLVYAEKLWTGPKDDVRVRLKGAELAKGARIRHPFLDRDGPLLTAPFVTMEQGTGLVHIAPGHGLEDFYLGQKAGLDVLCPVDAAGKFTAEAGAFAGQKVLEADPAVVETVKKAGRLIEYKTTSHSYPHCWRCKGPLIFRATRQWFLSMDKDDLRSRCLAALEGVSFYPAWAKARLANMIQTRPDWCLSRQRNWGVPVPVFSCKACGRVLEDDAVIARSVKKVAEGGLEAWFDAAPAELLGNARCSCGGSEFEAEKDILEVWLDAGLSHEAVLARRPELGVPADLYFEGTDQFRGWFQVSLIPSVALHDRAPYKAVFVHGFTVDDQGRKLSKSLGNLTPSDDLVARHGADAVRLWAASENVHNDTSFSPKGMERVSDTYRKIRNTLRFLLGNLNDFDPDKDRLPADKLWDSDRHFLNRLNGLVRDVGAHLEALETYKAASALHQFCAVDLSSFYLSATKDRLYCEKAASPSRRAAQTVLWASFDALVRMLAPILPFTAEEAYRAGPHAQKEKAPSVHLLSWPEADPASAEVPGFGALLDLRGSLFVQLEEQKKGGHILAPLEAEVWIAAREGELKKALAARPGELSDLFGVSRVNLVEALPPQKLGLVDEASGAALAVALGESGKCPRCWKRTAAGAGPESLCSRCEDAVASR